MDAGQNTASIFQQQYSNNLRGNKKASRFREAFL